MKGISAINVYDTIVNIFLCADSNLSDWIGQNCFVLNFLQCFNSEDVQHEAIPSNRIEDEPVLH
jgi:hypothetical protein